MEGLSVQRVLERRLLAAWHQQCSAGLPSEWQALAPEEGKRRAAAAVVQRLAELSTRAEMEAALEERARKAAERAKERGKKDPGAGERNLWLQLKARLASLEEATGGPQPSLYSRRLWGSGSSMPLSSIAGAFRDFLSQPRPPGEAFLTGVAKVLLRALAKSWMEEDRKRTEQAERGSRP